MTAYRRLADGDTIKQSSLAKEGDIALGKIRSVRSQESYGWKNVAPFLIGQEFFEGALELGHPSVLLRKETPSQPPVHKPHPCGLPFGQLCCANCSCNLCKAGRG